MFKRIKKRMFDWLRPMILDHYADKIGVVGKNLSFLNEPRFMEAWKRARELSQDGYSQVPDVRWRAHICCWAAMHGLGLEGDFVECGVNTGLFSTTVASYLTFDRQPKSFYLFDTFAGVPDRIEVWDVTDKIRESIPTVDAVSPKKGGSKYFDVFEIAKRNFAPYPNIHLVRGVLPGTLSALNGRKVAYLSVDLNNAPSEKAVIERLWSQITPGAMIVIDDYAWKGYELQHQMWDTFAAEKSEIIATLPTGQGLLIR
jgi:O-methyltransferase